jgi:hypothetical protein
MKNVPASCPILNVTGALILYTLPPDIKTCSDASAFPYEKAESGISWGGQMRIIAFLTDLSVVDSGIDHLKLTFVASKPPPSQLTYQELLIAAESPAEYF